MKKKKSGKKTIKLKNKRKLKWDEKEKIEKKKIWMKKKIFWEEKKQIWDEKERTLIR